MAVLDQRLEVLYQQVPNLECKRLCYPFCTTGPVWMGAAEYEQIAEYLGYRPKGDRNTFQCPLLDGDRCTIHPVRPMICRLWGNTEKMECLHGCKPKQLLTAEVGRQLLDEVYKIAGVSYELWGNPDWKGQVMKLTVLERLTLLGVLPSEGNLTTLKAIRMARESLSFNDEDHKTVNLRMQLVCPVCKATRQIPAAGPNFQECSSDHEPAGMEPRSWVWDMTKDEAREIEIGEIATEVIRKTLQEMNKRDALEEKHVSLCEKFGVV